MAMILLLVRIQNFIVENQCNDSRFVMFQNVPRCLFLEISHDFEASKNRRFIADNKSGVTLASPMQT